MGVEESKEAPSGSSRPHDRHHPSKAGGDDDEEESRKTPSQRAFAECWKSKRKNESNPLMRTNVNDQELKFMDVRPSDPPTSSPAAASEEASADDMTTLLGYEIFWTGDLTELGKDDGGIETLKSIATDELNKYGGRVVGEPRETGCMISMIGLKFVVSEEGAWELGKAMFDDFGEVEVATEEEAVEAPTPAAAPTPPVPRVKTDDENEPSRRRRNDDATTTPSRRAFASVLRCRKENTSFPLMRLKVPPSDQTFTFMDVRSRSPFVDPSDPTSLRYELLWSGEIEPNVDVDAFRRTVSRILSKYDGGKVEGDLHEVGGCGFVPMVGMSFAIREEGAMKLGRDMFDDFGVDVDEDDDDAAARSADGGGGFANDEAAAARPSPAVPSFEAPPATCPFHKAATTKRDDPPDVNEIRRGKAVENGREAPSAATAASAADACPAHQHQDEQAGDDDDEVEKDDRTPSQRAFGTCWESKERNEKFPLMTMNVGNQELKFMDVRPAEGANGKGGHPNDDDDDDHKMMHYEMFWTGELSTLDEKAFVTKVSESMEPYGGSITGDVRETGCMISMVGVKFDIRERDAMRLGKDMFGDFGR